MRTSSSDLFLRRELHALLTVLALASPLTPLPDAADASADLFNDSNFEGTPQLDTAIGGSNDVLSSSCTQQDGHTSVSWSRSLSTGDKRDWNITTGFIPFHRLRTPSALPDLTGHRLRSAHG